MTKQNESKENAPVTNVWSDPSDLWVIVNPDENPWTESVDWSLGLLLRRTLVRLESSENKRDAKEPVLLATPEGLPASGVLVLNDVEKEDGAWLKTLAPILTKMKVKTATIFAPEDWRKSPSAVERVSRGEWELKWAEA